MERDSPSVLITQVHAGIATLELNRPAQLNALSEAVLEALQGQLDTLAGEPDLRCVIIAGSGRAFCAGHDLEEMRRTPTAAYYQSLFARCSRVMQSIRSLPVPVIARVQGIATAAGCQLVGSCDLAIASQEARFAVSGINVGLFCSTPAVALSRNVSTKRAFDMLVTGKFIDAQTALDYGLINEVVAADLLDAATARKAAEIAAKSPAAIRHGKAMFYGQQSLPLAEAYALAGEVMARNLMEADACTAIDAFLNRRKPVDGA